MQDNPAKNRWLFAGTDRTQQREKNMIVTPVSIWVKPEHIDAFINATIENHKNSRLEPGNLRFDVLQSKDDPCRFFLYEAYATETAAADHKKTDHYARWRDIVAPFMAQPRQGTPCNIIAPVQNESW